MVRGVVGGAWRRTGFFCELLHSLSARIKFQAWRFALLELADSVLCAYLRRICHDILRNAARREWRRPQPRLDRSPADLGGSVPFQALFAIPRRLPDRI